MTASPPFVGTLDRIDRPSPGLYALSLRGELRGVVLWFTGPPRKRPAWALAEDRPHGDPADAEVRRLRELLEGGRVRSMLVGVAPSLVVEVRDRVLWVSTGREGIVVGDAIPGMVPEGRPPTEGDLDAARARAAPLLAEHAALLVGAKRQALVSALAKVEQKLMRRAAAIEQDLARGAAADEEARIAALFVPLAASRRAGTSELTVTDWASGEAVVRTLSLDPALPPREQLDRTFRKAKRLRAGADQARTRLDEAERLCLFVMEARASAEAAGDDAALDELTARLDRALPRDLVGPPKRAPRPKPGAARTHRTFESALGAPIFVGKDAASNDTLTVTVAKPGDLWLHARDRAGAHVVAPGWFKSGRLDQDTLLDAATLAAHFSDARDEPVVDVTYADRRHVRKRRGAARGAVEVGREKVLLLRLEPARLARLLASERSW